MRFCDYHAYPVIFMKKVWPIHTCTLKRKKKASAGPRNAEVATPPLCETPAAIQGEGLQEASGENIETKEGIWGSVDGRVLAWYGVVFNVYSNKHTKSRVVGCFFFVVTPPEKS